MIRICWLVPQLRMRVIKLPIRSTDNNSSLASLHRFQKLLRIWQVLNGFKTDNQIRARIVEVTAVLRHIRSSGINRGRKVSSLFRNIRTGCRLGKNRRIIRSVTLTTSCIHNHRILIPRAEIQIPLPVSCLGGVVADEWNHSFASPRQCRSRSAHAGICIG